MSDISPIPDRTPIVASKDTMLLPASWLRWLRSLADTLNTTARRIGSASLANMSAAVALTAVPTPDLTRSLYRVGWYVRITQAATVSSSVTVTIRWVDGGITCQISGPAIVGNTTATTQSESVLVNADADSVISYSVAYASVGATPAKYEVFISVERVP